MRIMLASPQDLTVLGVVGKYCESAIRSLGHEVEVFDFRKPGYSKNSIVSGIRSSLKSIIPKSISPYSVPALKSAIDKNINRELIAASRRFKPDLLLVLLGENITTDTLDLIRSSGTITANWLFDSIILPHRSHFMRRVAGSYDHIFLIDSSKVMNKVDLHGSEINFIPLGSDPEVHKRVSLSDDQKRRYGCDIAFVGTVTPVRASILRRLKDYDMKIWGRWDKPDPELFGRYQGKDIYGSQAVKVYNAAKIVIDIHGQYGVHPELFNVTPRVFEVPASGGFLLTNDIDQLHELYSVPDEIVAYKDVNALEELIRYYLSNDTARAAIAEAGYLRAHRDHTYKDRLGRLIDIAKRRG